MNQTDEQINHPGRKETIWHNSKQCIAATPPSKGGESFVLISTKKQLLI
jgi:hypothetical protein